ncbi:metallophosphoesterase [Alkalimonas collagenimarina]|uniref:Metallophosphoesterase n=1 Tax=Alkalimonas collagenimarina TaxID=400390 RepID=A0ABT9H050_9GAMM|nr:metallophosphoesterase [Alkalimonas collagenimarina]MDP4536653.1 metallophosphoesterase [Alkalimonas collagenimarina]
MYAWLIRTLLALCCALATFSNLAKDSSTDEMTSSVRIAIVGDINGAYGSTDYPALSYQLLDAVIQQQPDIILSVGDVVAGQKRSLTPGQLASMWQAFDEKMLQPMINQQSVWIPVIGNHDGSKAFNRLGKRLFAQERQLAERFWQSKRPSSPNLTWLDDAHYPYYFSLLWQDIAIIVIDASGAELSETEIQWLTTTLQSPAVQQARHRLVSGHLPLISIAEGRMAPGERLQDTESLIALFNRYQVDWYISGHQHAFYQAKIGKLGLLMAAGIPARPILTEANSYHVFSMIQIDSGVTLEHWDIQRQESFLLDKLPATIDSEPIPLRRWPQQSEFSTPTYTKENP